VAQYDVFVNPQPASRDTVPFVVDVQSGLIDQLPTRLVMPLSRVGTNEGRFPAGLCPLVEIEGEALSLMAHLAAAVPARMLRNPIASIGHRASDVRAALDAVVSGI
jgi:toxin CcdB